MREAQLPPFLCCRTFRACSNPQLAKLPSDAPPLRVDFLVGLKEKKELTN
jgi:hypothetical protein